MSTSTKSLSLAKKTGYTQIFKIFGSKFKLPTELIEEIFTHLPLTYLHEVLGADEQQLIQCAKTTKITYTQFKEDLLHADYNEILSDGTYNYFNEIRIRELTNVFNHLWILCKPIYMKCLTLKCNENPCKGLDCFWRGIHRDFLFPINFFPENFMQIRHIVHHNRLDLLEIIYSNSDELLENHIALDVAIAIGNIRIVKYLFEKNASCSPDAACLAAKGGYLEVIMLLDRSKTNCFGPNAMDYAAACGHIEVLKYLHENRTEGCTTIAMDIAAKNNHFEILKFLHDNRTEGCSFNAMDYAVANGNLEMNKDEQQEPLRNLSIELPPKS